MNMTVPFMTYFGDSIKSNLPDETFGLILSFLDLNAYTLMCRLNTYLRTITEDDWKHLLWVDNVTDTWSKHLHINSKIPTIHINSRILNCFINTITCMPLLFESAKSKKLKGSSCKHLIEHQYNYGLAYWSYRGNEYMFKNKQFLNGVQRYTTCGKLRISGIYSCIGYVDRLSTVIAFILSGFKRNGVWFNIKEVKHTLRVVFDNRHITVNEPIGNDPALTF